MKATSIRHKNGSKLDTKTMASLCNDIVRQTAAKGFICDAIRSISISH